MGAQKNKGVRGKRKRKRAAAMKRIIEVVRCYKLHSLITNSSTIHISIVQMMRHVSKDINVGVDSIGRYTKLVFNGRICDAKVINDMLSHKLTQYSLPYAIVIELTEKGYDCDIQMIGAMDRNDVEMIQILHI